MKKKIRWTILLLPFPLLWIGIGYCLNEFDPFKWTEAARGLHILLVVLLQMLHMVNEME
jgi:hypothetical protein